MPRPKGFKLSEKTKRLMSLSRKNFYSTHEVWNKGKIGVHTNEGLERIRESARLNRLGKKASEETKRKISQYVTQNPVNYWKGKKRLDITGKKCHFWVHGKSYEPYSKLFDRQLKEKVRVRDNFICQLCKIPELECSKRLHIHHIEYNKKNCDINNLISLCNNCHSKTLTNREFWRKKFSYGKEPIYKK